MSRDRCRWPALVAVALLAACCSRLSPEESVQAALARYFEAVQRQDDMAVPDFLASCASPEARTTCRQQLVQVRAEVESQRERNEYRFDDEWGVGLVRALVLGAGAFWQLEGVEVTGDVAVARVRVKTQYTERETAALPRGAVIEYLVSPLGRVERLERGRPRPGGMRSQLDEIVLEATLQRVEDPPEDAPAWRIVSLLPLRETAVFSQVTWRPR